MWQQQYFHFWLMLVNCHFWQLFYAINFAICGNTLLIEFIAIIGNLKYVPILATFVDIRIAKCGKCGHLHLSPFVATIETDRIVPLLAIFADT